MTTVDVVRLKAQRTLNACHDKLVDMGHIGVPPRLNMHADRVLPVCVYQPNTNSIAACTQKMMVMLESEIEAAVADAMAMCGCYRAFQADKRAWNGTNNKARMQVPALAMHGGSKWRSIRNKL